MRDKTPAPTRRPLPDRFSTVLQDLRLSAAHYCQCEVAEPWGLDLPGKDEATVHFVLTGRCWLEPNSSEAIALHAGDVVLLPRGTGHRLVSAPGGSARSLASPTCRARYSRNALPPLSACLRHATSRDGACTWRRRSSIRIN